MAGQNDREFLIKVRADIRQALGDLDKTRNKLNQVGRQGQQASGGVNKFSDSTRGATANLRLFHAALAAGAATLYLRTVVRLTDAHKRMEGQLKLVTDSEAELAEVRRDVFDLSQDTRSSVEATTALYARLARGSDELNLSQQQLLAITRATNQSIQLSGSTSQEAAAGVIQFSQAISSDSFQGDEFRSVLENMPRLARAIADGLGVNIKRLREMSAAGELTADVVTRALLSQTSKIESEYAKLPRQVGQALTQLQNEVLAAFEGTDTSQLTQSIDDFRDILSDPETIEAIQTFTGIVIDSFALATEGMREFVKFGQGIGTNLARMVNGPLDQITELEDEIKELESLLGTSLLSRTRLFSDEGVVKIFSDEEIQQRLDSRREELRLIREAQNLAAPDEQETPGKKKVNSTSTKRVRSTAGASEQDKLAEAIAKTTAQLRFQAAAFGLDSEAAAILKLELAGATDAQLAEARLAAQMVRELKATEQAERDAADAARERAEALADNHASDAELIASLKEEVRLFGLSNEEQARARALARLSADATDAQRAQVARLAVELERMQQQAEEAEDQMTEFARQAARNIQDSFADFLFDPFEDGLQGMLLGFVDTMRRITAEALAAQAIEGLFGKDFLAGGQVGGIIGGAINGTPQIPADTAPSTGEQAIVDAVQTSAADSVAKTVAQAATDTATTVASGNIQAVTVQAAIASQTAALVVAIQASAAQIVAALSASAAGGSASSLLGGTSSSFGQAFADFLPTFHTGGKAFDEQLALILKNEEILTSGDPRHIDNLGQDFAKRLQAPPVVELTAPLLAGPSVAANDVARPGDNKVVMNNYWTVNAQEPESFQRPRARSAIDRQMSGVLRKAQRNE